MNFNFNKSEQIAKSQLLKVYGGEQRSTSWTNTVSGETGCDTADSSTKLGDDSVDVICEA